MAARLNPPYSQNIAFVMLIAALLGLHLWSLLRFPAPFVDEAWLTSRAWGFLQNGRCFGALDMGIFDYVDGYWTFLPCLSVMIQAGALRLAGAPSLLAVRLTSLFFGFVLLGAIYWIGATLGGRRVGALGMMLVGLSYPFFYSAHLARPDIIAAALGYLALAIYLAERPQRRGWVGLLIGLTLGLAFEIHPNSSIYILAVSLLLLWELRRKVLRSAQFYGFLAGGLLGAGLYAAMHILPYPRGYLEFNRYAFNATHAPPLLSGDLRLWLESLMETGSFLGTALLLMSPVVILGVIRLVRRRSAQDETLLLLAAALLGSYILLVRLKPGYYAIFLTPLMLVIAANYLLQMLRTPWQGRIGDYLGRLAWGLALLSLAMNLSVLRQDAYASYLANQARINAQVRPGDVILGPQIYWFGLSEHRYLYLEQIAYYRHFHPQASLADTLRHYQPSFFIRDNHLRGYLEGSSQEADTLFGYLALSQAELEDVLARFAHPVAEFESDISGRTTLYRFDWDE